MQQLGEMHEAGPKFSGKSECKCVYVCRGSEQLFRAVALEDRRKFFLSSSRSSFHETRTLTSPSNRSSLSPSSSAQASSPTSPSPSSAAKPTTTTPAGILPAIFPNSHRSSKWATVVEASRTIIPRTKVKRLMGGWAWMVGDLVRGRRARVGGLDMSIGARVRVSDCSIGDGYYDNSWMRIMKGGGIQGVLDPENTLSCTGLFLIWTMNSSLLV